VELPGDERRGGHEQRGGPAYVTPGQFVEAEAEHDGECRLAGECGGGERDDGERRTPTGPGDQAGEQQGAGERLGEIAAERDDETGGEAGEDAPERVAAEPSREDRAGPRGGEEGEDVDGDERRRDGQARHAMHPQTATGRPMRCWRYAGTSSAMPCPTRSRVNGSSASR
jgi:hypothetical protein